ncbi:uncharacterized protein LOC120160899, partial [Hibiscus syriacus]|uniref:uncharacterized protein LOC120160899 n=1 Tax=Hibiscus syriacus TaxID=106335 RepID=UPI00192206F7
LVSLSQPDGAEIKVSTSRERATNPLVWCAAIICTVLTVAVIIAGIVTFIGYLVIHPRVPYVSVIDAHLNCMYFSDSSYSLGLNGEVVAQLVAPPFEVNVGLKKDLIILDFKGGSRVRWRISNLGSVRFLCRLDCQLHFYPLNGTYIPSRCTSKTK